MQSKTQILKTGLMGVLALLLLNFPFLTIPNKIALILSVPVLFVYVFGIWLGMILAIFLIVDRKKSNNRGKHE